MHLSSFLAQRDTYLSGQLVFTNGCFDILHPGHVDYLVRAKALGAHLVVGLNSDRSIRRLKGSFRPINCEHDRMVVLSALECVDQVILFDQEAPLELIQAISPDILVKGGDWPVEDIVGREHVQAQGGQVRSLPLLPGYSTSRIIDRILCRTKSL
ncbi:MAG: D-glycero-beta-D-manno-heptose 1-phosphate adenylyltransferase [Desulfovermiculus sp.]